MAILVYTGGGMNNYKLTLQYDGSRYNGWQKQNDTGNTIQQILTDIISGYTGERIKLIGSGRTDAGVHALGQVANFRCRCRIEPDAFMEKANKALPEDIRIIKVQQAADAFHSRYSSLGKTYVYRLDTGSVRSVFERKYSWRIEEDINLCAMRKAAVHLTGEHDFRAFCTDAKEMPYTVKNIYSIEFHENYSCLKNQKIPGIIEIEYSGSGFLYNMVRILTGTLVDIGLGKFRPDDIETMLSAGVRSGTGQLAPAKGLLLKNVEY